MEKKKFYCSNLGSFNFDPITKQLTLKKLTSFGEKRMQMGHPARDYAKLSGFSMEAVCMWSREKTKLDKTKDYSKAAILLGIDTKSFISMVEGG